MENTIDGIFEDKYYRYIPYNLRSEWKTIYNIYSRNFYVNLHKKHKLFPIFRIDYYNEELQRLNNLEDLCFKFKLKVNNLKNKLENEVEYSNKVKKSLLQSLNKIEKFIKVNKNLLSKKINSNNIPLKKNIESFDNNQTCNDMSVISNNKFNIVIMLVIIILFFYLTFN